MKRYLLLIAVFTFACGGDDNNPTGLSSSDLDKFLGKWAGMYECGGPDDEMIIAKGSGALDVKVTLHSDIAFVEVLDGELTAVNVITIPEQTIGGFPGSAKITYANGNLSLEQMGFGITCKGSGYTRISN